MSIITKAVKIVKTIDKCVDYNAENNTVVFYLSNFSNFLDIFKDN